VANLTLELVSVDIPEVEELSDVTLETLVCIQNLLPYAQFGTAQCPQPRCCGQPMHPQVCQHLPSPAYVIQNLSSKHCMSSMYVSLQDLWYTKLQALQDCCQLCEILQHRLTDKNYKQTFKRNCHWQGVQRKTCHISVMLRVKVPSDDESHQPIAWKFLGPHWWLEVPVAACPKWPLLLIHSKISNRPPLGSCHVLTRSAQNPM
jgi:hypothetical protein